MLGFRKNITGCDDDSITREIAERCANAVLAQLSNEARQMNAAQLRGYVRARVWSRVSAEIQDAAATGRVRQSQTNEFAARVLEQAVHIATAANTAAPVIAMPVPHIVRRAA
jgi:hypothetical protein